MPSELYVTEADGREFKMLEITYHIFGFNPLGFHLVNILFHSGISVLVFLVTSRLLKNSKASISNPSVSPPPNYLKPFRE
jgi:hypothetical protein